MKSAKGRIALVVTMVAALLSITTNAAIAQEQTAGKGANKQEMKQLNKEANKVANKADEIADVRIKQAETRRRICLRFRRIGKVTDGLQTDHP